MKFIISIMIVLSLCDISMAKNKDKKIEERKDKYHSIFDLDTNNITVEICCLPKTKPDRPTYPISPGSWF
ncbi:hypothetical protein EB001_20765 [bacterium]|nr:hypothetical protein [bacterium]